METTLAQDVGWLLGNARQYAGRSDVATAAGFARADGFEPVHRSAVVRWEHGQVPVTHDIVRRYEQALDLPYGQLLSAVESLARIDERGGRRPFLVRPTRPDDRDRGTDLLERALEHGTMTGRDWDVLTQILLGREDWLVRHRDWEGLISRLALEVSLHVGVEFTLRDHALVRLATHPRSTGALTTMARRTLDDPGTQIYSDVVGLLQYSSDPAGTTLLVDQVAHPRNEPALWACLFTVATQIRRGLLSPPQVAFVTSSALRLLRDETQSVRIHREAASLLRLIDPPTRRRIVNALSADSRKRIAHILAEGSALAGHEMTAFARRLEVQLRETMQMTRWPPTLDGLLRLASTTTHDEERGAALAVLMLSPQAPAVASAFTRQLSEGWLHGEATLVDDALTVLSWLVQPHQADELTELAFVAATHPVTSLMAAGAAGNARVSRSTADRIATWTAGLAADRLTQEQPDPKTIARAHAYLLGMWGQTGHLAALAELAHEKGADPQWERTFRWWLDLPAESRPVPLPA